jgi:hypothetical protein
VASASFSRICCWAAATRSNVDGTFFFTQRQVQSVGCAVDVPRAQDPGLLTVVVIMRKLLLAATAAALIAPSTAGATATQPPGTCDLVQNTACQYIPPTSVEDVCGILDHTTFFGCSITTSTSRSAQGPGVPTSWCELQEKLGIVNVRACEDS